MKVIERDEIAENELDILKGLEHENIVKYYTHFEFSVIENTGVKKIKLAIITEYYEVSLLSNFVFSRRVIRNIVLS